jgi:hypothetical protein
MATLPAIPPQPDPIFPAFTTTFPDPTVVFANLFNQWPSVPPMTVTTQNVIIGGWTPWFP